MSGKKQGFTLVEIIMAMAVIAIIMYSVIAVFITSGARGVNVEVFTVAQSLAEGKLEENMAHSFSDVSDEVETNFSGDLGDYSYEIVVNYVSPEALDLPVAFVTDYKKIQARIRHPQLEGAISLEAIRANY